MASVGSKGVMDRAGRLTNLRVSHKGESRKGRQLAPDGLQPQAKHLPMGRAAGDPDFGLGLGQRQLESGLPGRGFPLLERQFGPHRRLVGGVVLL